MLNLSKIGLLLLLWGKSLLPSSVIQKFIRKKIRFLPDMFWTCFRFGAKVPVFVFSAIFEGCLFHLTIPRRSEWISKQPASPLRWWLLEWGEEEDSYKIGWILGWGGVLGGGGFPGGIIIFGIEWIGVVRFLLNDSNSREKGEIFNYFST